MDELIDQVQAEYDAVPYESHAFPQSAPGQLAAMAHLFGLDVPDVSTARVLEIGCSAGGNLIPFAMWHPEARAVGIDLSPVQVEQGRKLIEELGLSNIELVQGDISRFDRETLGQFDYIVCHGVYSWVPDSVQESILKAFRSLLAPTGVAYNSYNVYPGWKAKEIVRDAMLLRGGAKGTPEEKLSYARGMINFLEEVAPGDSVLAKAVSDFKVLEANSKDYYLTHEYLEAFNSPCYFLEMVTAAGENDLIYLGDTQMSTMFAGNYGDKVAEPVLKECGHSQVLVEQYLDFAVNRAFRQSMLVHAERAGEIRYQIDRARYADLHFAAFVPSRDEVRLDDSAQEFGGENESLVTRDPRVKVALEVFNERWPWTLTRAELIDGVRERLATVGVDPVAEIDSGIDDLIDFLVVRGLTRLSLSPVSPELGSEPFRLYEPARRMAEITRSDAAPYVYNVWHETVPLTTADSLMLSMIDGEHDSDSMVAELVAAALAGTARFERDGAPIVEEAELRAAVTEYVNDAPKRLDQMRLARAR